jgi:hypothetical protein
MAGKSNPSLGGKVLSSEELLSKILIEDLKLELNTPSIFLDEMRKNAKQKTATLPRRGLRKPYRGESQTTYRSLELKKAHLVIHKTFRATLEAGWYAVIWVEGELDSVHGPFGMAKEAYVAGAFEVANAKKANKKAAKSSPTPRMEETL